MSAILFANYPKFLSFFLISCQKLSWIGDDDAQLTFSSLEEKSLNDFSLSLSQLLFNSEDARSFIKSEALTEYDNDTDVFYPVVKDKIVGNTGKTFRELLLPYFESEATLALIEDILPLLTIYVPDASWIVEEGFNASNWDTSSKEVVALYRFGRSCKNAYANGQLVSDLSNNRIPACASVIVKNNERIIAEGNTKSGTVNYKFVSDVYDGSKKASGLTRM